MPGLTGHLLQITLICRSHKPDSHRKRLGIVLIRSRELGEFHKIRPFKQFLQLFKQIRRSIRPLHILEYLCSGHLHSTHTIPCSNIFPQCVCNAGVECLLLFRSPHLVAAILVQLAQSDYMCRILLYIFRIMCASVTDYQPDKQGYQTSQGQSPGYPWGNLGECHRVLYHTFYIMRLECGRIHRHGLYLDFLRLEHKSVEHPVLGHSLHSQRRKIIYTFIKGSDGKTAPEVEHPWLSLLCFRNFHSIHLPRLHYADIGHQGILYLRECEPGTFFHLTQFKAIEQLVGDEHGIPLLQRLQE